MTKKFLQSLPILILLTTLLFSFGAICQDRTESTFQNQMGFSVSPEYTNQYQCNGQLGISTGINYTSRTKSNRSRWDIGILYTYARSKTHKLYTDYYPTLSDTFKIGYWNVQLLDFPIKLNRFLIENDKIIIYFIGGISFGSILKNQRQTYYYETHSNNFLYRDPKKEISWYQNTTVAFHTGIGTEYKLK